MKDSKGSSIPFANVYLVESSNGKDKVLPEYGSTETNEDGYFVLEVPPDRVYNFNQEFKPVYVRISHLSFIPKDFSPYTYVFRATYSEAHNFNWKDSNLMQDFNGTMYPMVNELGEVVVVGEKGNSFPWWLLIALAGLALTKKKKKT